MEVLGRWVGGGRWSPEKRDRGVKPLRGRRRVKAVAQCTDEGYDERTVGMGRDGSSAADVY